MTEPGQRPDVLFLVQRACARHPEAAAIIFEDGVTVTRGELWASVLSFAGFLAGKVERGDRVAVMLSNRVEFMVIWLATIACRAQLVAMNPSLRRVDAGHVLRDSGTKVVITDDDHRRFIEELQMECPAIDEVITVGPNEPDGLADYASPFTLRRDASAGHDLTNIYYTSGTTGPPKGCVLDHSYWHRFVELISQLYNFSPNDRLLCCLQFFYNDPPWQLLLSLCNDTPLIAMRRFSVSRYWDVVRHHNVTVLFGIAATASLLLKAPVTGRDRDHGVRIAIHCGIPADLHHDLVQRWGIPWVEVYGLTETGVVVAMPLGHASQMTGSGSIGLPCPGTAIRLVDDHERQVPVGALGEIIVRGPGLMRGYLNRPDATAETMRGGWLHTGDLACSDERGFLYFKGRSKDIIRRSGENVAATEVEGVVRSHPRVLEAAVVPALDALRGEEVKVHVQLSDATASDNPTPAELVAYCAEHLAPYKIPRYVEFRTQDFERTPSMRVKKEELDRSTDSPAVWDRQRELEW